jgi:hypothetical protein
MRQPHPSTRRRRRRHTAVNAVSRSRRASVGGRGGGFRTAEHGIDVASGEAGVDGDGGFVGVVGGEADGLEEQVNWWGGVGWGGVGWGGVGWGGVGVGGEGGRVGGAAKGR